MVIEKFTVTEPSNVDALTERLNEIPSSALTRAALSLLVLKDHDGDELSARRNQTPKESLMTLNIESIHFGDTPFITGHVNGDETTTARLEATEESAQEPGDRTLELHVLRDLS